VKCNGRWNATKRRCRGNPAIHTLDIVGPKIAQQALTRMRIGYTHAWVDEPSVETFEQLEGAYQQHQTVSGRIYLADVLCTR
jgi:hypothetical protein